MVTEKEIQAFDTSLREALVELYDESSKIKTVVADAEIRWGDVNQNGAPRAIWLDAIELARQQGKLRTLVGRALSQYSNNVLLKQLLDQVDQVGGLLVGQVQGDNKWAMSYQEVNRRDQLNQLGRAIRDTGKRPLVAIWCGDDQSGHEILWTRIKEQSFEINGRQLAPKYGMCVVNNDDVAEVLTQTCFEKILDDSYQQEASGLDRLRVGRDFANHLIGIRVHISWGNDTHVRLNSIIKWCHDQKSLSDDRRMVVAVSIKVPRQWMSFIWEWFRVQAVEDAHNVVKSQFKDVTGVYVLPLLRDIHYGDLLEWKEEMGKRWGPRGDDAFRESVLNQIVSEDNPRPMEPVSEALRTILKNSHS